MRLFLTSMIFALAAAFNSAVLAQENDHKPASKDAPVNQEDSQRGGQEEAAPKGDALDDLFEKAEEEIKNGDHCGPDAEPDPELKTKPIA